MPNAKKFNYSVVVLGLLVKFVVWGLFSTFSMYFEILVEYFDSTYALIGTVGTGVAVFSSFIGGLPSFLEERFSYPSLFIVGGILIGAAYFWTSFDTLGWEMFFTYSLLFGMSGGILSQISISLVFDAVPEEMVGFITVGSNSAVGLGYMFFSLVSAYALYTVGISWQALFRWFALGGVSITVMSVSFLWSDDLKEHNNNHDRRQHTTTSGNITSAPGAPADESTSLLRSFSEDNQGNAVVTDGVEEDDSIIHGFELLLHSQDARSLFVSNFIGLATRNLPLKYSIVFISSYTTDNVIYYIVPICIGLSVAISRIAVGYAMMDKEKVNSFQMNKISQVSSGIVCMCIAFCPIIVPLQLALLCLHEVVAGASVLIPLRMVEVLGKEKHSHNFGVSY